MFKRDGNITYIQIIKFSEILESKKNEYLGGQSISPKDMRSVTCNLKHNTMIS